MWRWLAWPQPRDLAEMRAIVDAYHAIEARIPFAQVAVPTGEPVGMTSYDAIEPLHRTVEVGGTWLGRPWWRTAINTEAKLLLLGHAFDARGARRVQLKTDHLNERSQAAIAALGGVREGLLRNHHLRRDGSQRHTVMFSVTAEEWPAVRGRLEQRLRRHA